jgi:sigma-B regulation protein RsbU (phosphoserine phosphatase)
VLFENIFLPSDTIGGDFYYVDEIEIAHKKHYLLMVADVSGHGVAASMLTVLVKDVYNDFRITLENDRNHRVFPFLVMLNQKLLKLNLEGSKFVTAFIALLDVEKKTIQFSSAGHPPAILLCSKEDNPILLDSAKSPPTGIFEDITFRDEKIALYQGCQIILYTDGLTDVFGNVLELVSFLTKHSSKNISDLKRLFQQAILSHIQEKSTVSSNMLMDDITVILASIQ